MDGVRKLSEVLHPSNMCMFKRKTKNHVNVYMYNFCIVNVQMKRTLVHIYRTLLEKFLGVYLPKMDILIYTVDCKIAVML